MLRRTFAAALPLALFAPPTRAQASKKLVVYTSNDSTLNDLVFGAFKTETGIEVEPVAAGSGVVMRRLQAEKARPLGDIVWGVSRSLLQTNKALFEPYGSKNRDATPAEYRDPDNLWIGNNLHLLVILQNTKIVPDADAEDERRLSRERGRLVQERTGHINRIKGLLMTMGIYDFQPTAADREGGDRPDTCERAGEELLASVLSVDNALKHTLLHAQRGTIDFLLFSIRVFEGVKLDGDPTLWGDLR